MAALCELQWLQHADGWGRRRLLGLGTILESSRGEGVQAWIRKRERESMNANYGARKGRGQCRGTEIGGGSQQAGEGRKTVVVVRRARYNGMKMSAFA